MGDVYCDGKTIAVLLKGGKKEKVPDAIRSISDDQAGAML